MSITVNIISDCCGHFAAGAIESVLGQSQPPDKVRLIDNGGQDCDRIAQIYHELEFVKIARLPPADVLQLALDRTDTERCMMLSADDWLRNDALHGMGQLKQDIVSCDVALCGEGAVEFARSVGAITSCLGYRMWRMRQGDIKKSNFIHRSSLFNTKLARQFKFVESPTLLSPECWSMWKSMLAAGGTHRHHAEPFLYSRRHRENLTRLSP